MNLLLVSIAFVSDQSIFNMVILGLSLAVPGIGYFCFYFLQLSSDLYTIPSFYAKASVMCKSHLDSFFYGSDFGGRRRM